MSLRLFSRLNLQSHLQQILTVSVSFTILIGFGSANAQPFIREDRTPFWSPFNLEEGPSNEEPDVNAQAEPPGVEEDFPVPEVELPDETADQPRFRCEIIGAEYTVMYYPVSQGGQGFAWAVPGLMGGGWTPERRCNEISRRLEAYRPDGLSELLTSVENGYNIICATTEDLPDCRIVLTVPPGENPIFVRDRIFQNLVVADSGSATQGVYTLQDQDRGTDLIRDVFGIGGRRNNSGQRRSNGINLKPFLAPEDGGWGTEFR